MMNGFRSYFFNNFYVSGVRTGIQAGHAGDEMWVDIVQRMTSYPADEKWNRWLNTLMDFAKNHKTYIVLHGGGHDELYDLIQLLTENDEYPWSFFSEPGLNNAITSVRIILPERMYSKEADRVGRILNKPEVERTTADVSFLLDCPYSNWEREFLMRKMRCGLAD